MRKVEAAAARRAASPLRAAAAASLVRQVPRVAAVRDTRLRYALP